MPGASSMRPASTSASPSPTTSTSSTRRCSSSAAASSPAPSDLFFDHAERIMRQLARKEPLKYVRLERGALGDRSGPLGMIAALGDMVDDGPNSVGARRTRQRNGVSPRMCISCSDHRLVARVLRPYVVRLRRCANRRPEPAARPGARAPLQLRRHVLPLRSTIGWRTVIVSRAGAPPRPREAPRAGRTEPSGGCAPRTPSTPRAPSAAPAAPVSPACAAPSCSAQR